jgi:hypothetical protein
LIDEILPVDKRKVSVQKTFKCYQCDQKRALYEIDKAYSLGGVAIKIINLFAVHVIYFTINITT